MTVRRIEIVSKCEWWSSNARIARFFTPSGECIDVIVLLGPEIEADMLERAQERSRPWLGQQRRGVLTLLGVDAVAGRVGWIYQGFDGVSLGALMRTLPNLPSQRIAAEIVAGCAELCESLWTDGLVHPGFDLEDVLLRPDGSVLLAGFVGPFARSPVHRDLRGAEDAATAVWRLGVLLTHLLTGVPLGGSTDRVAHDLVLRRALVRIMSRPGHMFPERYRDWQCAMLSWSPEDRPMLARISSGLREIATSLPPPDLLSWAKEFVLVVRRNPRSSDAPLPMNETIELSDAPLVPRNEQTEEVALEDLPLQDDVTAISTDGDPPRPFAPIERGAMPVQVGPPPEALPKALALPEEIFGSPLVLTDPETPSMPIGQRPSWPLRSFDRIERSWRQAIGIGFGLALIALVLSWYLLQ